MNRIDLKEPLPGIHDAFARCLIAELDRRLDSYRFTTSDDWLINIHLLRPNSRFLGYRVAQVGFIDDEIWFFLHLDGDAETRRYGREDAQALYNLSDPKNGIEEVADSIATFLKEADKDDDAPCR